MIAVNFGFFKDSFSGLAARMNAGDARFWMTTNKKHGSYQLLF
ncbi:hypothetical protein [Aromatoleum aromaticum]|nr:hypothetical protein [Aromatoleum aromaticum]